MEYTYRPAHTTEERDEPYYRMREQGLLLYAMYAFTAPSLEDWRRVTTPAAGFLLRCESTAGRLLSCGLFSALRGKVWEFDFTVLRPHFHLAVPMARGAFSWIFTHTDCAALMGLCPLPNRHARSLAAACGFQSLGQLPLACHYARKGKYVDGELLLCTPEATLPAAPSTSTTPPAICASKQAYGAFHTAQLQ